jgi:hypothetical protein
MLSSLAAQAAEKTLVIHGAEFKISDPSVGYTITRATGSSVVMFSPGLAHLMAPVHLPDGAVITGMEIAYHVISPTTEFSYVRIDHHSEGNGIPFPPENELSTTKLAMGFHRDAKRFDYPLPPVNNETSLYNVEIDYTHQSSEVTISAVRIRYELSAGSSPVNPSFSDVPADHPYYRFIEALAAAGVTGGCGDGKFCPATPVTRGELAVLLSAALGLYFPIP